MQPLPPGKVTSSLHSIPTCDVSERGGASILTILLIPLQIPPVCLCQILSYIFISISFPTSHNPPSLGPDPAFHSGPAAASHNSRSSFHIPLCASAPRCSNNGEKPCAGLHRGKERPLLAEPGGWSGFWRICQSCAATREPSVSRLI